MLLGSIRRSMGDHCRHLARVCWRGGQHERCMTSQATIAFKSPTVQREPPKFRLEGKVALVTGAGGGIGRRASVLFAKEGADVVVSDLNLDAAIETATQIQATGGRAVVINGDVASSDDVAAMVAAAEREFGGLHVLFNNAGIMLGSDDNAMTTDEATIDKTFDVNVKGVLFGCKHGIPAILRSGGGSVINTASFVAHVGAATPQVAYTASKGAVLALTRELAVVHAREKVRVNALSPGPIRTELLMNLHLPPLRDGYLFCNNRVSGHAREEGEASYSRSDGAVWGGGGDGQSCPLPCLG